MRLRIRHQIHYRFAEPVRHVTNVLRLTPRSYEGQHVIGWRIDVDVDCILKAGEDGFGNVTHRFTTKGPLEELTVSVSGDIENFDTVGIVRGSVERLPLDLYLRDTALTTADPALRGFADAVGSVPTDLGRLHALMGKLHETIALDAEAPAGAAAEQVFAARRGTAADASHVFIACARHLGFPARFVNGYYFVDKVATERHGWSEAFLPGLGWIGFDAVHDLCPEESHVRVATGLDALGAAPVRAVRAEAPTETVEITVPFVSGWSQSQSGSQGGQSQSQGGQSQSQGGQGQRQSQGGQSQSQGSR